MPFQLESMLAKLIHIVYFCPLALVYLTPTHSLRDVLCIKATQTTNQIAYPE